MVSVPCRTDTILAAHVPLETVIWPKPGSPKAVDWFETASCPPVSQTVPVSPEMATLRLREVTDPPAMVNVPCEPVRSATLRFRLTNVPLEIVIVPTPVRPTDRLVTVIVPKLCDAVPFTNNAPVSDVTRKSELVIERMPVALSVNEFRIVNPMLPGVLLALLSSNVSGMAVARPTTRLLMVMHPLITCCVTVAVSIVTVTADKSLVIVFTASSEDGMPADHLEPSSHFPPKRNQLFVVNAACAEPASSMLIKQTLHSFTFIVSFLI